jgi:DNA polymerase epsilon subunit 1
LREKSRSSGSVQNLAQHESIEAQLLQYKKKLISQHFSSDLTRMVAEIIKDGGDSRSFPILPGSHLTLTNPSLEFIKNIMQILKLDLSVELEVSVLNRSLLSQIGIQEYDPVTQWQNPCAGFILPDVFCAACHESRDINLCALSHNEDGEINIQQWTCEECGRPYETQKMEWRLVKIAQRMSFQYQMQDLRCSKTQSVAKTVMSRQSGCSVPFKLEIPHKDMRDQLVTLQNLAEFYGLDWLLETATNLLENFVDS